MARGKTKAWRRQKTRGPYVNRAVKRNEARLIRPVFILPEKLLMLFWNAGILQRP